MAALNAIFGISLTLLATLQLIWSSPVYELDDNSAHGVRCSGNDEYTVMAVNNFRTFAVQFFPYKPSPAFSVEYPLQNLYVYSLAVVSINNNMSSPKRHMWIFVAEDMENQDVFLGHCVITQTSDELKLSTSAGIASFYTYGVDSTETYAVLGGFNVVNHMASSWAYAVYLVSLNPLAAVVTGLYLDLLPQSMSETFSYKRANDMSVAINPRRSMVIVGLPKENKVVLVNINAGNPSFKNWTLDKTRTEVAPLHFVGFGRSVVWMDDRTVAVSILTVPNRPWAQSEIWVFDVDKPFTIPLFTFPSNHQKLMMIFPPLFLQTHFISGNLIMVVEHGQFLIVRSQPVGFISASTEHDGYIVVILDSIMCPPGTYKNTFGLEPCTVCPPQTKNPGNQPCTKCTPCASTSFCPLGSVGDISLDDYPSYTQTFSYPSSPDMNNYDDLLVQNIFSIGQSRRCILISPLFWTIIMIILCFVVWFLMTLPKIWRFPQADASRNRAKKFLKKADIISEGERWIGGLFSFAVVLLFAFTFWFASEFLKLYPIETLSFSSISCDDAVRNAVFDSGLQLPLPNPDGNRWAIFDMFDAQPFTMMVDLLNTAADCSSITVQQNRPGVNYLRLSIISCIRQPDNATLSIRFLLPAHRTNVQLNITGPYFVGGMRACLNGSSRSDGVHTLQALDMCQLFFTPNETLSQTTTLHMVIIKVINVTKPLNIGDNTHYTGRWASTFAESSLSDELIYDQDGHYLRYVSSRITLSITLSEQPFYLQNNQQPIVRKAELAFHTLLFCTLIIELFAMGFLIFRLILMPLIRALLRCCRDEKLKDNAKDAPEPKPTSVLSSNHGIL